MMTFRNNFRKWLMQTYPVISEDEKEWIYISGSFPPVLGDYYDYYEDWQGDSGSSYCIGVDYAKSERDRTGYFRFIGCEYCGTRNSNNDKTFYCVSCGGPLPT